MEYSFSLFFTKLINYTFLYWLPKYLKDSTLLTCAGYFILTIPSLFVYREYGGVSAGLNIFLLFLVGFLANGPYALITTAVSADLGTHPELKGSTRALATVTAIIDGTGSIGAAVGPLIAGALSDLENGWDYLFYALMVASALGLLLLTRLMINEAKAKCKKKNNDD
uniref:Major facilitator superfamily (MFS) profile domain-containing protein n=1 Tax=Daphnia galeata TaxID=27404 RepID=A0A8J2RJ58_9CRUS|nr:unnamed protein product [Daphnia galeata]